MVEMMTLGGAKRVLDVMAVDGLRRACAVPSWRLPMTGTIPRGKSGTR